MARKSRRKKNKGARAARGRGPEAPTAAAAGPWAGLSANLLIFAVLAYGWLLEGRYPDFYYRSVQEDEYLEWATFWGFIAAAGIFVLAAVWQRRATGRLPWFLYGVGLFCFFVGMEEISWGQRLLGYRPPDYFLAENFQQELNIHNVTSTALRKLVLKAIILGYGVVLAIGGAVPAIRRRLTRLNVVAPPAALAPAFLAAYLMFEEYPWKFTGEWVELMLALAFLAAGMMHAGAYRDPAPGGRRLAVAVAAGCLAILAAGVGHAAVSRLQRGADPQILAAAERELDALRRDFQSGRVRSKCNRHKRLYSFMEKYDEHGLVEGSFAELTSQGLPESRMRFLLDPWNNPYWIRDRCRGDERVTFVYSFGPNKRRDSDRWEILGDDVGAYIRGPIE